MGKRKETNDIILPAEIISGNMLLDDILDCETGEVMDIAETVAELEVCEQQIALGFIQTALALKTIRDKKLYLARCNSMKEYISITFNDEFSLRTAERYLRIADAFNESTFKKFKGTPMKLLLEITGSDELTDEANDPESNAADVIRKAKEQERKKLKKKMDELETVIDGKEAMLEGLRESTSRKDDEIGRLKNAISGMASKKGIDPEKIIFITQKQEALALVEESFNYVLESLGNINNIPQELMDADLTAKLSYTMSAIKAGIRRIENAFFIQLTTANDEIGILPEE